MSLKAYDGLMSRKGLPYIQEQILERLPRLKKASENQLAKAYAEVIIEYTDKKVDPIKNMMFYALHDERIEAEMKKMRTDGASLLSIIFQASKILARSKYMNPFTVHLNITLDSFGKRKTLINPNIIVPAHGTIISECFEDWYAQDQTDPPKNVSPQQWRQRVKDWYEFDEHRGYANQIHLFSPTYSYGIDCVNETFRGDGMVKEILKHIPSNKKRINRIVIDKIIKEESDKLSKKDRKEKPMSYYSNMMRELQTKEGKKRVAQYIKDNPIKPIKINDAFLSTHEPIK